MEVGGRGFRCHRGVLDDCLRVFLLDCRLDWEVVRGDLFGCWLVRVIDFNVGSVSVV